MNKNEFIDYLTFLKEMFPRAPIPKITNKELLEAWYKPFTNTHKSIAINMAQMYFQEEQNTFNYARLLQYKSKAMAGRTYHEESNISKCECPLCDGIGIVQVEVKEKKRVYLRFYRCKCRNNNMLPGYVKQINEEILKDKVKVLGVWKIKK